MTHEDQSFTTWEDMVINTALRAVQKHKTFTAHPREDGMGNTVIGWVRNFKLHGISKRAATVMLQEDLRGSMDKLRARMFTIGHERLGVHRGAVLLFLAQLPEIGPDRVLGWTDFWSALREERWDDAADHLLITEFPKAMRQDDESTRTAVALQRALRSGKNLIAEEQAVAGLSAA